MASQFLKNIASGALLGTTPGVTRPTVKAPSPFDDEERMDISDRFRPTPDYTSPDSFYSGTSVGGEDGETYYTGALDVTGIGADVGDRFVGMDKYLGAGLSPLGFNPFIAAGSAISKKNLTNIQNKMRAGEAGYGVGMLGNRIIGVSPGPFGGYVLSGVLPEGLTAGQRKQIIDQLLAMNYQPPVDPAVPPGSDYEDPDTGLTGPESDAGAGDFDPDTDTPATPVPQPPLPDFDDDPDPDTGITPPEDDAGAGDFRPGVDDPFVPPPTSPPASQPDDFYPGDPGMDPSPPSQPDDDSFVPPPPSPPPYAGGPDDPYGGPGGAPGGGTSPDDDDDDGGGGKIVCTAMNQAYGFGSFRQAIWLAHSRDMAPEYQAGYHAIFQPLVTYGYGGVTRPRKFVRNILEGIARRRTADIWMQKKGKRHPIGRIERAFWEPVCYAVGRIVLCLKK